MSRRLGSQSSASPPESADEASPSKRGSLERADALNERAGRKAFTRGRSRVDASLPFRERLFDELFLHEKGDRETVRLLMRGMPLPVCFGFPGTDGSVLSNWIGYVKLFHPCISICFVHPLCPFSAKERFVVFICTVAFNFLLTAFFAVNDNRFRNGIGHMFGVHSHRRATNIVYLAKAVLIIIYAVLIRQLVICPCLYKPVIDAACKDTDAEDLDDRELHEKIRTLRRWKRRGDRTLLVLLVLHVAFIVAAFVVVYMGYLGWVCNEKAEKGECPHRTVSLLASGILMTEFIQFFGWFLRLGPIFPILFPIHRAMWYKREDPEKELKKYLLCRASVCDYTSTDAYNDPNFAPCVQPDTRKLGQVVHARTSNLSTFRSSAASSAVDEEP